MWEVVKYAIKLGLTSDEDGDEGDALCSRKGRNGSLRLKGKLK